jgi:hypothetical protein
MSAPRDGAHFAIKKLGLIEWWSMHDCFLKQSVCPPAYLPYVINYEKGRKVIYLIS